MKLFNVVNQVVLPTEEVLLISPFKEIWDRDFSEHKFYAIKEFSFIEFMCSPKKTNPFSGYIDKVERAKKIIANIYSREAVHRSIADKWEPDDLVIDGCKVYLQFLNEASPALDFLNATEEAIEKLKQWFKTVDLNKTNAKGALLYKPVDITNAASKTELMIKTLVTLRDKVEQELFDNTKTLKNRKINPFEEAPINNNNEE